MNRNGIHNPHSELRNSHSAFSIPNSELPAGWRWVRLGEVLKEPLKNGLNYSKEGFGIGVKFVNVSDIFCPSVVNIAKLDRINISHQNVEKYRLKTGDILIVRSSLKREGVAYPALFEEDEEPVVFCGFLIRIRPDKEKIEPFYLLNYLRSSIARERLVGDSDTVTITNVDQGTLLSLNIPLPPLSEQKLIAAKIQELMQEIYNLKSAISNQLEAAKALPTAYLREVFESEEAKKWERKRLGEVCEIVMGQSPPSDSYNKEKIGLPFFQGKADFGVYFPIPQVWCSSPLRIAKRDDVLISVRAPVGPVNMANQQCCIGRGLTALRGKEAIDSWFLFFYFKGIENNWKGRGSTFDAIRKDDLKSILVPFPPLGEQTHIANKLKEKMAQVENLQSAILNQKSAIEALPEATLKKVFKGEL
ncbi:MAG: restriction endonuclease subunit S [Thermodesulfovibrionales bacterium]|nr:restriction endonuclease subunit S [Thermodesulfovibrionales bacterium]